MITSEQGGWNGYREITTELCVRKGGGGVCVLHVTTMVMIAMCGVSSQFQAL